MLRAVFAAVVLVSCASVGTPPAAESPRREHPALISADGEIIGVDRRAPEDQLASGVRVTLRTAKAPVVVDLAPGWYLGENGLTLERPGHLRVEGHTRAGEVLYATSVAQGGKRVQIRDASGKPLWTEKK
jgi:hypothetical protein